MRILVVDDKFQSRWLIAGWLSAFLNGVAVESAASADETLAVIEQRRPDLLLAAHSLPELDGIALVREVKTQANPPVVVVMTDQAAADFEAACSGAGADYWLEKRHLQARLLAFLQQRFGLAAARRSFI